MDLGSSPTIHRTTQWFKAAESPCVFTGAHRENTAAVLSQLIASGRSGLEVRVQAYTVNATEQLRDCGKDPVRCAVDDGRLHGLPGTYSHT